MAKGWMSVGLLMLGFVVLPAAAQAPPSSLDQSMPNSLPAELPNAFTPPAPCTEPPALYGSLGYLALERQRLGHGAAALFDTASGGIDTGNPPPAGAREAADFHDVQSRLNHGLRVDLGYHCGEQAFEVSGFYLSQNSSTKTYLSHGAFDSFFNLNGNLNAAPLGFEGDNGMWLQSDVIKLRLQTAQGSAEANYRCWFGANADLSWLIGVRYFDLYERFSFYSGDDDLTVVDVAGHPDPRREATYSVSAHNQIVAPQLGLEWNHALNCWLALSMSAKGAWGANFLTVDTNLKRGDGFLGFHNGRSQTLFSHLYETGFFLNIRVCENARVRAGYNLLWLADVAEALGQFDYNLAHTSGRTKNNENIFYHGPSFEFQWMF